MRRRLSELQQHNCVRNVSGDPTNGIYRTADGIAQGASFPRLARATRFHSRAASSRQGQVHGFKRQARRRLGGRPPASAG